MHIFQRSRGKNFDDKAVPCIFFGYEDADFGYKLWDPENKKMIRSQDVIFHEYETVADRQKPGDRFVTPALIPDSPSDGVTDERNENHEQPNDPDSADDEDGVTRDTEGNE